MSSVELSLKYGELEGYPEGSTFTNRIELSKCKVHRQNQAGICGNEKLGAESIVVSGGYEDDSDEGNTLIYTGQGGRDQNTGKQIQDQKLSRGNAALATSARTGIPVRVIRGAHKTNIFAPSNGYRYDGLFRVSDYWQDIGKSGFKVWRFRLEKVIQNDFSSNSNIVTVGSAKRIITLCQRIVRDTMIARQIKELYDFNCQVCNCTIRTSSGLYSEAAHIRPLGQPHNGPDVLENILCLCPNHHTMFDFGVFSINNNFQLIGIEGSLSVHNKHKIGLEFLEYHRLHYFN